MEQKKVNIENLIEQGQQLQLKPQGYSMYPLLVPGRDEAILEKADPGRLKRGDVALYRRDGGILVLHRIWKVKKDGFYMVGDNQKEVEGPLRPDQIKGVLVGLVRKGKRLSVTNPWYVLYSRVWLFLRPARPAIARTVAALKRFLRKRQKGGSV